MGHWCGYIRLKENHPWFGKESEDITEYPKVHGGLTWSRCYYPLGEENQKVWWIGFDCAHVEDTTPREELLYHRGVLPYTSHGYYKDRQYVVEQIEGLVEQAQEAERNKE